MPGGLFERKTDDNRGRGDEETVEELDSTSGIAQDDGDSAKRMVRGRESAKLTKARLREINKGKKKRKGKKEKGCPKKGGDAREESEEPAGKELAVQKFHRGFFSALLWWLILFPIILIPIFGFILAFSLVPFVAGRMGSRWVEKKYAVEISFLAAFFVTLAQIWILYAGLQSFAAGTVNEVSTGGSEFFVIALGSVCNLAFAILGGASGKKKHFKQPEGLPA